MTGRSEAELRHSRERDSCKEPDWLRWGLSPAQKAAAEAGVGFLQATAVKPQDSHSEQLNERTPLPRFLIWAVTGAGKTEMIFPLIEHELAQNRQVLITTPRKDVVLELAPRLIKAFPECTVVSLYGGSEERWSRGQVTLATTHQLMRFYQAFDLVIIDELDAYPYHNNPVLIHAAEQVCKRSGRYVLLSATPPVSMQKEVDKGALACVRVPVRYHRHPLPVPRRLVLPQVDQMLKQGRIPGKLRAALMESLQRGAQVFVFVPRIAWVEPLVKLLSRTFPEFTAKGTSSKDEHRRDAVQGFRDRAFALLVTTTILERGVTVPKSDVFILGADAGLFDEASLVQMAGRAGRSKDDPAGRVFFGSKEWTATQLRAIGQIRQMNRLAANKGYLLDPASEKPE
jgi:late competence protein required for DNA uptake (superfamily II DNA/RNA helicase)